MDQKVVVLTGASRGIGHATVKRFNAAGWRVNALSPGEIATVILSPGTDEIVDHDIPMKRLGRPEEVAAMIYFLCTDAASYVNGAEIHVNGGQHV